MSQEPGSTSSHLQTFGEFCVTQCLDRSWKALTGCQLNAKPQGGLHSQVDLPMATILGSKDSGAASERAKKTLVKGEKGKGMLDGKAN